MSVVAFNDAEWLSVWNPPITAVDIASSEMAHITVEILLRRISAADHKGKPVTYHLSTFLIERNSCKDLKNRNKADE
jgi:DNA-binding LacI/PurR family transcriptional regulator